MKLFRAIKKANEERDIETLMSLYHDDFEFVRHQSGTTLKKSEYRVLISGMFAETSYKEIMHRCIYENDDILVQHMKPHYSNGTKDATMHVSLKKDGLLWRTETGVTSIKT